MALKIEDIGVPVESPLEKEEQARVDNSLFYAEQLGVDPETIYELEPELNVEYFGTEVITAQPGKMLKDAFLQSLADKPAMALRGVQVYTPGKAYGIDPLLDKASTLIESLKDPVLEEKLQKVASGKLWPIGDDNRWWQVERKYLPEVINAWAVNVGDQIPLMLTTFAGRAAGKAIGKPIGAAVGAGAALITGGPDPSDVATAPAVVGITQEVIKHLSGAAPLIAIEAASYMDDAEALEIDPDIKEKYARLYGVGSGAIEYAQQLWVLGRYSKIAKPAQETVLKQVLSHLGGAAFEGVEEISQGGLENFLLQKAVSEMKERHPDYDKEAPTITEGWKRNGAIGAGVAAITGLPGTGMSIAKGQAARFSQANPEAKKFLGEPSVQEIRQAEEAPTEAVKPTEPTVEPTKPTEPTITPEEVATPVIKPKKLAEAERLETPEEAKKAEQELDVEAGEEIEAELYIGSITPGMKKRLEAGGQFKAEDIKGFHKPTGGPFSTIREKFKLTRGEAEQYLEFLQDDLTRRLDNNLINTENDLAKANADWGDIRNVREALGLTKITRPFTVERAERHKIKVIPDVKKRIKEAIRPTIESEMTVGEVLRTTLKRSARFAKMGFVKGRQELRAELRAKARAKKRLNKALKAIQQKIPQTVDFFFREAIESLRTDLDLKSRGKRTEATIKSRKEFLERATEEQKKLIPLRQIKQLGQKSLNELTIEQLEEIAESIKQLVKQGKLKRKLSLKPELEQRQKDIQELTENTEKVKPSRKKPGPQSKAVTEKNLKDKIFDIVKPLTWRPSRIFDWLDGRKNFKGAWHRIFFDNVKGARANQIRTANTRKEALTKEMSKLGVTMWQLSEIRDVNGVRWSVQEMIGVYLASKNKLSRMALNFGHDMTDVDIKNVIEAMTDKEKALGDFLLADYEANYPKLRRSVIEQENRDSGIQENYSPIRRKGVNYTTLSAEFIDDIINKNTIRKHTPAKGMTVQRQNVPPSLQTEIRLDAINVWNDQVEKEARYIFMGPTVRHMNKIMANRNLRKVISERFGNEMVEFIAGKQGYISRVANPYIYKQFGDIERISGKLRRNTATAYLAYNLVTMGKQLPSALLYLPDAGPSHLIASAIEFATNPRAMIERTRSLDPELKNRSIERELEEIKNAHNGSLIRQKITNAGMEGIFLFDTVARTIGWNAVRQRALNEGESEGEAIRLARNSTLRTQPAAAAEDLPALYTTSEFLNWFTMFTNQLNQLFNIATYDIPSYIKNEQYGDAAMQAFGMGVVAVTIWMITNRKLPEEPEEFAEAISEQAINMIPLFGKPIMAARNGWGSDIPVFDAVKGLYGAVDDLDFTRTDSREIAEGIAVVTGIPYTVIRRGVQAIEEEQPTALLGARRPAGRGRGRRRTPRR